MGCSRRGSTSCLGHPHRLCQSGGRMDRKLFLWPFFGFCHSFCFCPNFQQFFYRRILGRKRLNRLSCTRTYINSSYHQDSFSTIPCYQNFASKHRSLNLQPCTSLNFLSCHNLLCHACRNEVEIGELYKSYCNGRPFQLLVQGLGLQRLVKKV